MAGSPAVIDASVAPKLVLPDPLKGECSTLVNDLVSDGFELIAPALWAYEATSTLCTAVHFGQLTPDEGKRTSVICGRPIGGYSTRLTCRGCGGWAKKAAIALRLVRPNLPPET